MASRKPTYIDLFAGCGGLSYGLGEAGWQGLFAVEKSPMAFATFEHNLLGKESHFKWPKWLPKKALDIEELLDAHSDKLRKLRGKVDLVAGGPPCQGFSMAGKRQEDDARNSLINYYLKIVDIVQPKVVFFENVSGIARRFKGPDGKMGMKHSDRIAKHLCKLGYELPEQRILNFAEYGLPQSRRRFIMVAVRKGDASLFFDELERRKEPFLREKGLSLTMGTEAALSDLLRSHGEGDCPDGGSFQSGRYGKARNGFQRLMREGKKKGAIVDSHRFPRHFPKTIEVFENLLKFAPTNVGLRGEKAKALGVKKRNVTLLDSAEPSPTILSIPDDYVHYSEPRIMTVRECARLQTFPDNFEFVGKYTTGGKLRRVEVPRYTQVGNAIPPMFAELVGFSLVNCSYLKK